MSPMGQNHTRLRTATIGYQWELNWDSMPGVRYNVHSLVSFSFRTLHYSGFPTCLNTFFSFLVLPLTLTMKTRPKISIHSTSPFIAYTISTGILSHFCGFNDCIYSNCLQTQFQPSLKFQTCIYKLKEFCRQTEMASNLIISKLLFFLNPSFFTNIIEVISVSQDVVRIN